MSSPSTFKPPASTYLLTVEPAYAQVQAHPTKFASASRDQDFGCAGAGAEVDAEGIGVGSFTMAAAAGSSRSFR